MFGVFNEIQRGDISSISILGPGPPYTRKVFGHYDAHELSWIALECSHRAGLVHIVRLVAAGIDILGGLHA